MNNCLLKALVFCLLGTVALAQGDYRFRNYTINDGLSQSSVSCILQDDLNAFWIGTQDGLNRYDGHTFEIFTSDDTEGLESEYIKTSLKDDNGNLWFGTTNGLTKFDLRKEVFSTYSYRKNVAFQIEDIALDNKGNIWVASTESGLYRFDPEKKEFRSFNGLVPSKKTTRVAVLSDGKMIVATSDKGVYLCDDRSMGSRQIRIKGVDGVRPVINKIIENGSASVLLATNQGVYELATDDYQTKRRFTELDRSDHTLNISDVYQHNEIGWYISTKGDGLYLIPDEGEVQHFTEDIFQKTALLFNELNLIFKDNSGTMWVGSQRGLSSFDPSNKGILGAGPSGNPEKGIPFASVWSFNELGNRYFYIGTDKAISRLDKQTGKYTQYYRTGRGEHTILSIYVINENHLLAGCADGLFEVHINGDAYEYEEVELIEEDGTKKHQRAYSIEHWKGNQCFVATTGGVILYDYETNKVQRFEHDPKNRTKTISKGICRLVYRDLNNRYWFTTSTGGLNVLHEDGEKLTIRPYAHNSIIKAASKDYISSIYHDDRGNYWFGTMGSGLIRWNESGNKIHVFSKKDGLPNDVIYGVVSDDQGTLWLSTNKGLSSFFNSGKRIKNYTEVHGLMSNEFNLGAFMKTSSGELFFGGIYGYNYFNPSQLQDNNQDVSVVFSRFKLENEWLRVGQEGSPLSAPVFVTNEINLGYNQRSFTLCFQPSDLSNPDLINYKYVLEGSEEGEVLLGSMNEVRFNALSPGKYELKIYARIGDGPWSVYPAEMKINIASPFWSTWWFWMIFAGVLFLIVRLVIRRRVESARREQVRLEMKVRERTREIQKQSTKIEAQKLKIEEERNKVLKQQELLKIEKDKSEKLLKNVIPESTAEELKKRGRARARGYKTVSVLFTDFVGFTTISEGMSATELVKKLDVYFTKFDDIIVRNNLEKIKTIGDAYMCAGGVPVRNNTNPIDTCLAALQIQAYMQKRKNNAIANNQEFWELRLGINTGEVTAGVIGSERLHYDIWGATVNQAQRMEMLGQPGKITITGATYQHIEPYFECTFKGKAQSKSRGLIDMYEVDRIKPELSIKGEGILPNSRFQEIVNLHHYSSINYYKAERHIMKLLERHLSKALHYHSIAHTKDVVKAVERLALLENVTDEGLFLLKSAATYHDAGFIEQYDANEPIGVRLAGEILPKYGYTVEHIERIKELIYVTRIPHEPKSHLEEIICDADLDYLGRDDFHEIADKLRLELREHGKINSDRQWDEIQVNFLTMHKYFTKTAIKTRKKKKLQNLQEVKERLERDEYKD